MALTLNVYIHSHHTTAVFTKKEALLEPIIAVRVVLEYHTDLPSLKAQKVFIAMNLLACQSMFRAKSTA